VKEGTFGNRIGEIMGGWEIHTNYVLGLPDPQTTVLKMLRQRGDKKINRKDGGGAKTGSGREREKKKGA